MGKFQNLIGQKFCRLTVVNFAYKDKQNYWLCQCDCGNKIIKSIGEIKQQKSCGCLRREKFLKLITRHNLRYTRFYKIWQDMKARCYNKKNIGYKNYTGRGIAVCKRWLKFENFRDDMRQSYLEHCGECGEKQTMIDRINNNGNYQLNNCRWVNRKEQNSNTRKNVFILFNNKKQTINQWERELNIDHRIISLKNKEGWNLQKIINFVADKKIG